MITVEVIAEYRKGTMVALLERLKGTAVEHPYRITYSRRFDLLEKVKGEFLSFVPPSQHDKYISQISENQKQRKNKA